MIKTVQEHIKAHPLAQIDDLVKLLYQGHFGSGHFVKDEETALQFLTDEYAATPADEAIKLFTPIGPRYCRINLGSPALASLPLGLICRMFLLSAKEEADEAQKALFLGDLARLGDEIAAGRLPYTPESWNAVIKQYKADGYPAIHHSSVYKAQYKPAYRVVRADFFHLYPVIQAIVAAGQTQSATTLAIDGPSGTGKSYSAQILADLFDANLIHMDDYFLRPAQRAPARLKEAGGNLDYERFSGEIIPYFKNAAPFRYQKYSCQTGLFTQQDVAKSPLTIVEGVYSLHPFWGRDVYDIAVFFTADMKTRLTRIKNRNGGRMLSRFVDEWIPKEDQYFAAFSVPAVCDITINTTGFGG